MVPGSPLCQHFPTEIDSPTVHTPQKKIAKAIIESDQEAEVNPSHSGETGAKTKTKTGNEVPITTAPQRLPDSPFLKRISPKSYQRPGTPYRKVDPPHREDKSSTPGVGSPDLGKPDDPIETDSDSEGKITFRAEPKETPKHKLAPVVLPFNPKPEEKTKSPGGLPVKHVVGSPPRSPLSTPPTSPTSFVSTTTSPIAMGTVEVIKNALIESNRVAAMPIPQFYRKKREKPEHPIMKVEDYFQNYNITDQKQKCNRFRDTCGKAQTWLSTLTDYPSIFDPEKVPDEAAKAKTMKALFLARWQLKGRTPQALYMEWQNLKFDPAKDDIEDFCNDVRNLTNRLGYPEDAQVMAIQANLPPVLVTQVINVTTFKEIRDTSITLVENPVIKRVLLTEGTGEKGLAPFNMSQVQWQPENDVGMCDPDVSNMHGEEGTQQTPKSIGTIMSKIDNLEYKMHRISTSEDRDHEPPYKPQVAPSRHRGGGSQIRGAARNTKQTQSYSS